MGAELGELHLPAVQLGEEGGRIPPTPEEQRVLFRAPYPVNLNTMYDVSPDGQRFVIAQQR